MGLVVKVVCGHFCIACLRPLTQRYVLLQVHHTGIVYDKFKGSLSYWW
ncbi:hypothetical protein RB978_004210 [Vibrio vulnificus]|nr:hypothetical protein [Vibrio vulnificus]